MIDSQPSNHPTHKTKLLGNSGKCYFSGKSAWEKSRSIYTFMGLNIYGVAVISQKKIWQNRVSPASLHSRHCGIAHIPHLDS